MHSDALPQGTVAAKVQEATGASPLACYQCGRCSAGCPQNVPGDMDLSPTHILRLLQLEAAFAGDAEMAERYRKRALESVTPWLCAGCQACSTRCPQGVDIAGIMDVLRHESLQRGCASTAAPARAAQAEHAIMLAMALNQGRIHELSTVVRLKMHTGRLFEDALMGLEMFRKGKLNILPPRGPDNERLKRALERFRADDAPSGH